MKKILLTAAIVLMNSATHAQNTHGNFKIENGNLVWQKIYEIGLSKEEVIAYLKEKGTISDIEISDGKLTGQLTKIEADYKGYGKVAPIYIERSFLTAFVLVNFKESRYRVTLKNIRLIQKYSDVLSEEGEETPLKNFAIKNRKPEFKNGFKKAPSGILNYTFNKVFTATKSSDDW